MVLDPARMPEVANPNDHPLDPDGLGVRRTVRVGWLLLAVSLPFGVALEALHALKAPLYLGSDVRREMWRLAHAHGTLLGVVCLVFAALAPVHVAQRIRASVARQIRWGAVLMPLGFFAGGILNSEGDPSLGVLITPVGAVLLIVALARVASRGP
jgi:hypothetical protein